MQIQRCFATITPKQERDETMMVILYASNIKIANLWQENIVSYKTIIVEDEMALMQTLSTCKGDTTLLLEKQGSLEDTEAIIIAVREWYASINIFLLSQLPSFSEGRPFLELGIKGYGNTHMQAIHMQDALQSINARNVWLYPEFIQQMIGFMSKPQKQFSSNENDPLACLSPREKEVAMLIYEGLSNQEIADLSGITLRTVKAHNSAIYEKLHVKDRVSLVLLLKTL